MKSVKINTKTLYFLSITILIIAFTLFYFSDGIYKITSRNNNDAVRIGPVIKGLFELLVLLYAIITIQKTKLHILFGIFLLSVSFLIGQFLLSHRIDNIHFLENVNRLFKYFFPFISFLLAIDIIRYGKYSKKIWKIYKWIITINSLLIVLGFMFSIQTLRTYTGPWRFGYDGLIYAQNEATFLFIFAIATVYYRKFYLGIKELFFWIVVIPSLLVATKAIYLFVILLIIFHITQRISLKKFLVTVVSFAFASYFVFSSSINKVLINSWQVFMYWYYKSGLLTALLSGRNLFIQEKVWPLITQKWVFLNFFIGGQDVVKYYTEMGLVDLFLFFGLFGSILYLFIFFKIINFLSFNYKFKLFFIGVFLLIVITAGHFFESGIAGIHLIFFILINRKKTVYD